MRKNTKNQYGTISKVLHWGMAILIIAMLACGIIMADLAASPLKWKMYMLHKSVGLVVLFLIISRLIWRFINIVPELPASLPATHRSLAKLSPYVLYAMMITMVLSGYVMSDMGGHAISFFDAYTLPHLFSKNQSLSAIAAKTHGIAAYCFIVILTTHVFAAFYRHFVLKNEVLRRMLPSSSKKGI
jgi:cytochrome b561